MSVLSEAESDRLPATDINGGATYGDSSQLTGRSIGEEQWSEYATLDIGWQVDLFGRVRNAIDAAAADAEAVAAARDAVRITVAAETTRAYLNACSHAFAGNIARESLKTSEQQLRLVRERQQAGSASRADLERARAVVASSRAQVTTLNARHRTSLYELATLLGVTPAETPDKARQCEEPPAPNELIPVGNARQLLRRRPDLRRAEQRLAADAARVKVAVADLYPRITLGGSLNYFNNDLVDSSDAFSYSVGPLISWSFPNQQAARARVRRAEARESASYAAFKGAIVNALGEVEKALVNVASRAERTAALEESMEHFETAYELSTARYEAGAISYVDLLVAEKDLLEARARYADSVQQLASHRVTLFKTLGGGWKSSDSEATGQSG